MNSTLIHFWNGISTELGQSSQASKSNRWSWLKVIFYICIVMQPDNLGQTLYGLDQMVDPSPTVHGKVNTSNK